MNPSQWLHALLKPNLSWGSQFKRKTRGWNGWRQCRYFYRRLLHHQDSPEVLARGFAVGVFAGFLPLFGLQMIIAISLATLIRGNQWIAALSTWISNPLTYVPLYALNFQVGLWLLNGQDDGFVPEELNSLSQLLHYKTQLILALLTGSVVLGVISGSLCYFLGLKLLRHLRRWR